MLKKIMISFFFVLLLMLTLLASSVQALVQTNITFLIENPNLQMGQEYQVEVLADPSGRGVWGPVTGCLLITENQGHAVCELNNFNISLINQQPGSEVKLNVYLQKGNTRTYICFGSKISRENVSFKNHFISKNTGFLGMLGCNAE